ncbi:hypothetical protein DCS_03286 [Drechmeria coniospora]|uniref:Carrier domain-containing protein n=1 Tax=Drechmeria coniospora TaxID=98403 RepID=A0A151GYE6_DRECN|nr:hypothetical protein DCS_03286 [Drechmeria coniospora]KYK62139.1 hypothetical protein DCS_03286 [Drechmeria coniospora]ODA81369.1 hypothetical protein RJ55_04334 [Drechmeria coniospora]
MSQETLTQVPSPVLGGDLAIYPFQQPAESRTLVDILDASTSAHPDALAIDNGTSSLTYAELAKRIAARVEQLRAVGVGVGDRVGIRVTSGTLDLYVGILAIITAGAAYVPVDVDDPDERAEIVWTEASVCTVLTDNATLTKHGVPVGGPQSRPGLENDAWIIFTSGSTGKPKGVAVSHRSAAAFVDAETELFMPQDRRLGPGDRVLAGLSVAFDASCEEMWLAWRHGACLVPAPRSLVKAGADLGTFLTAQRISAVSTVPTLAALWPTETLRGVRLLILGGEACSPELAGRLAKTVEFVWNTYGPTEATVVTCAAPLVAGEPLVRIGLPLVGWKMAVVGSDDRPVRWGEEGELVIGGVGMARYLDLEKDKVKFAPASVFDGERAYRSGDLVRAEREGLVFIGRNDEQIKLGGRRIELGEIDAALMTLPGVGAAASAIRRSELGMQVLVGYVVRDKGHKVDVAADRELLKHVLPAGLVPMLVAVDDLPVRTSGKVDRKALPWPPPSLPAKDADGRSAFVGTMAWLAERWGRVLGVGPDSPKAHFFDLGGSSLGAAQLVSQLRERVPTLSVADVYENPALEAMATRIDDLSGIKHSERLVKPTPRWVVLVQLFILFFELSFQGLRWLTAVGLTKKFFTLRLGANSWAGQFTGDMPWWLLAVGSAVFLSFPGRLLTTALAARLLTIGITPGSYPRGGWLHIRLWAAERFAGLGNIGSIGGTQWCRRYARMLGCQVGKDAQLHGLPPTTGLASFGAGCAIEPEVDTAGWWLDGDILHVGSITIGEGARVGSRSTLMPNTVLEAYADVPPGTCVQGTVKGPDHVPSPNEKMAATRGQTFWSGFRYTTTLLVMDFFPLFMIAPTLLLTPLLVRDYADFNTVCLALVELTLPGTAIGIILYCAFVISLTRLLSLAMKPGVYSWHSTTAWAAWWTHGLMITARTTLFPIYASLLTPIWLKMLGARIGRNVEASTIVSVPSLLEVDDGAFLADDVLLSPFELGHGQIRLGPSTVGFKTFVGNSAIVEPDIRVPDGVLIGVLGTAPKDVKPGSSWLGRPPMSLPRRVDSPVDEALTFKPPRRLVLARALVESCRLIPLLISGMILTLSGLTMLWFLNTFGIGWSVLAGSGMVIGAGLVASAITTLAKWLLTPVIKPGKQRPLWSSFVWRNELADTFVQCLGVPWFAQACYGTPMLSMWMRTLGAKIGRGVWLESHLLPEAELIQIDAGASVNRGCVLQTHLFHDRLMRLDTVHLEAGATLGPRAITLPGTTIGAGATVAPSSLVMRGEHIPAGTRWRGNPVRPWVEEEAVDTLVDSSDWRSDVTRTSTQRDAFNASIV